MTVRSTFLTGEPREFGTTPLEVLEAEPGRTAIVKRIVLHNLGSTARTVKAAYDSSDSGPLDIMRWAVPAAESVDLETWWVVLPNDGLFFYTTTGTAGGLVRVCVFGTYLDGAPE